MHYSFNPHGGTLHWLYHHSTHTHTHTVYTYWACVIPFIFDESKPALTLLRGNIWLDGKAWPRRCCKEEEEEKFTQSLWIWHEATSILRVGGLFDVMRLSGPPPPQPPLVNPSLNKVRRIGSGLSFCRLKDDPRVFQEQQSQGLCECHLQGRWEWRCLCYVSEPTSASSTGVLRDRCNFGPPSFRLHCLCRCVCTCVSTYSFSVSHISKK